MFRIEKRFYSGIYLAFFESQPNYFKIGKSKDLQKRIKSSTYRTAFGKPPTFLLYKYKKEEIDEIEKKIHKYMKTHFVLGSCGKEVYERGNKNNQDIQSCLESFLNMYKP